MRASRSIAPILVLSLAIVSCRTAPATDPSRLDPPPTTYLIHAGTLLTGTGEKLSDRGIVVSEGRIESIGSWTETRRAHPDLPVLDASRNTVMPGLIDAHAHVEGLGQSLETVSLVDTTSYEEVIERIAARAENALPGEWILGRGWDQNDWPDKSFPTAEALDRRVPDNPVWVSRIDGHASLANTAAMRAAGVTAATVDPPGGRILRDGDGNPTGVFVDAAEGVINRVVPPATRAERKRRLAAAASEIASNGLTQVHDTGVDGVTIDLYRELADEGDLPIRVYAMLSDNAALIERWFAQGPLMDYRDLVTVRAVKLYADGALGSRGASLLAPYADEPSNSGLMISSTEHIQDVATRGRQAGFQVNTHAIGDRGVRSVIDAYEAAGVQPSDRFRIEHLQVIAPEDVPRLSRLGIIASMQPTHATSDMPWAERRIGPDRIRGAYAWRTILDAGGRIAFGSDFPVEQVNPWHGVHAAVTRQNFSGQPPGGWYPQQRLSVVEALQGFSSGAAYGSFEETRRGTITPGKDADLTITATDPTSSDSQKLYETEVRYTIVGGKISYAREE